MRRIFCPGLLQCLSHCHASRLFSCPFQRETHARQPHDQCIVSPALDARVQEIEQISAREHVSIGGAALVGDAIAFRQGKLPQRLLVSYEEAAQGQTDWWTPVYLQEMQLERFDGWEFCLCQDCPSKVGGVACEFKALEGVLNMT